VSISAPHILCFTLNGFNGSLRQTQCYILVAFQAEFIDNKLNTDPIMKGMKPKGARFGEVAFVLFLISDVFFF
jgi:hypothetical protein